MPWMRCRFGQRDPCCNGANVVSKESRRILVDLDVDLIAFLDDEAKRLDRSRTWLVNRYCTQAMNRKRYQRSGRKKRSKRR